MNYLAIDTSKKDLAVLARRGEEVAVFRAAGREQHSVVLMDAVDDVLSRLNLTLRELNFVACVVGPGSFTGIRIGISCAKGLCFGADLAALGVTSLAAIAYAERAEDKIAVVDAGHGHVYAQGFGQAFLQAGFYSLGEIERLALETGACVLAAEGVPMSAKRVDICVGLDRACQVLPPHPAAQLAAVYLRKSNAEEGR